MNWTDNRRHGHASWLRQPYPWLLWRQAISRFLFPNIDIAGVVLADKIPIFEQFAVLSTPATISRYFHGGFLSNVALSVPMIQISLPTDA